MSSETNSTNDATTTSKKARGGGGGGRGRGGRGRGGGRGGGGGNNRRPGGRNSSNDNNNNNNNNQDNNNNHGRNATNFAGRGPKHFGNSRSRPDRVVPKPVLMASDDEDEDDEDDDDNNENEGGDVVVIAGQESNLNGAVDNLSLQENDKATEKAKNKPRRTHHSYCLVCYTSTLPSQRSITPCGHDDICAPCHLRLRFLHNDRRCPVCKTSNETLIVDSDQDMIEEHDAADGDFVHHKRYPQYEMWGNDLGGNFVYREEVGMHFPRGYHDKVVVPLFGYACGMPRCGFENSGDSYVNEREEDANNNTNSNNKRSNNSQTNNDRQVKKRLAGLDALKSHLRTSHGMTLCDLCVEHKRDFVSKLPRFTPQGLKTHQSKGDGDMTGFTGHPLCEFCRPLRFYDIVKLHEHLNKEHYKCHICDKMGKPNQFFKDYDKLALHFDREHFACQDPQCLAARFVVFENEIDLRGHEASVHGTSRRDGGTKIKLEFRVRRDGQPEQQQSLPTGEDFQFGLNGEAFVPEALPGENQQQRMRQANEPTITNAAHAARTAELRAQAARVREQNGLNHGQVEAFPALGAEGAATAGGGGRGAASAAAGSLVGWTSGGAAGTRLKKTPVGKVTEEEFPSLGGGSGGPSRNNRYAALGLGRPKTQSQSVSGPDFSAVASRTNNSGAPAAASRSYASSTPISTISYASSMPLARAPDMTANNFPSLGGGTKMAAPKAYGPSASASASRAPNLSATNFPSLGGGSSVRPASSNPYAAANALAKKLNAGKAPGSAPSISAYPSLSSSADFPPPPAATTAKRPTIATALASKKPPPMDNVLQFPPPSQASASSKGASAKSNPKSSVESLSSGMATVEEMKERLGSVRYKKLKSLTKSFNNGSTPPEQYVEEAAAIFDKGLSDEAFWLFVPDLVRSIPNEKGVDQALRHLETLRIANEMQEQEFGGNVVGRKNNATSSAPAKKVNYILPAKKKNTWGNNNSGGQSAGKKAAALIDDDFMDSKPSANNNAGNAATGSGAGKKSKAKKKNNELKSLAFGI